MFADIAKMAAKVVALVAGVAIIVVLFTQIQIPAISFSLVSTYLNIVYSVGVHYLGSVFPVLWTLGLAVIGFDLALVGIRVALIAIKWVLKVNE